MAAIFSTSRDQNQVAMLRRAGSILLIVAALAAIVVHGKTGRGPKPVLAETAEMIRFADRPQAQ
jgi:Flp pilus assembly CpaF family ATPase